MLTVLIPCKNERHNIEACIDSARLLGGEILVADSGSTDGTLQFVAGLNDCRLIEREFVNYADFKNWAIPQASHPWVFVLDADERVTPELADEVRRTLAAPAQQFDAYRIRRRTFFLRHEVHFGPWLNDAADRLFRRDTCRYGKCRVHEGLVVHKRRRGWLRNRLLHYTINSYNEYFAKYVNYTRWGATDRWENGRRTSPVQMLLRPTFRFFWLYLVRGGFLDGAVGLQACMLQAFFVTFVKQCRLWEFQQEDAAADAQAGGCEDIAWPAEGKSAKRLSNSLGIYRGDGKVTVKVAFAPQVARYVAESNWHASQKLTQRRDGSLLAEFELDGTEEIKRWIMGFGSRATVLEPASLRAEMIEEFQASLLALQQDALDGSPTSIKRLKLTSRG